MTGWLIARNSIHVMVTSITFKQYLKDQLSKDRKSDILEDMIKQFDIQVQYDK